MRIPKNDGVPIMTLNDDKLNTFWWPDVAHRSNVSNPKFQAVLLHDVHVGYQIRKLSVNGLNITDKQTDE